MPSLDLSNDWRVVDDPATVTLLSRTGENVWAAGVTVNYAQRNAITKEDIAADGSLLGKVATVFHLWTAKLSGAVPKVRDKITYLGTTWLVHSVTECDRDAAGVQRYRCITLKVG